MTSLGFDVVNARVAEGAEDHPSVAEALPSIKGGVARAIDLRTAWVRPLNDRLALPLVFVIVAPLRLTALAARLEVILSGRHHVAESQRRGARTAGVGRGAAVVECERRRAAGDRHRLAHVERQRCRGANLENATCG